MNWQMQNLLTKRVEPSNIWIITDAGIDLDDELALILASSLQRLGKIKLLGVTANMRPSIARARLARGLLNQLGYGPEVPVGMGLGVIESRNGEPCPTDKNCSYLAPLDQLVMGDEHFINMLIAAKPKSITLVLQSGFADAAATALLHGNLLADRVCQAVMMSGVEEKSVGKFKQLKPDNANNNTFNMSAAEFFFDWCQKNDVPMTITSRHAVVRAQVPFALYDTLCKYPSPIGPCLRDRQYPSISLLWQRANEPAGTELRGPLPPDRNRAWFVKVFCGGKDPLIGGSDNIVPHLGNFNLYDPINMLNVWEAAQKLLFAPRRGNNYFINGVSSKEHNVANPDAMRYLLTYLIEYGIAHAGQSMPS